MPNYLACESHQIIEVDNFKNRDLIARLKWAGLNWYRLVTDDCSYYMEKNILQPRAE